MPIKKTALVFIAVVVTVPALILNTPAGYVPLTFLTAASLISILYTLILPGVCKVTVAPGRRKSYTRCTEVVFEVTVENKSFLVLPHICVTLCAESFQGFPPVITDYILMLGPREKSVLHLPMRYPHLGIYDIKIRCLRFYGFFGVFSLAVRPRWRERVHITPDHYPMEGLSIDTTHPVFAVDRSSPGKIDGGEYSDVRQYVPGDPIKNIHWKLSAHTLCYVTRVMQTDAVSGLTIYLDLHADQTLDREETANINDCTVESAYSAALRAFELEHVVEFIYASAGIPTKVSPRDRETLFETVCGLPQVSGREAFPLELLISQYSCNGASLDNVLVLTSTVNERLINVLFELRQRGKYPILCRISPREEEQDTEDDSDRLLVKKGIRFYKISSARQLAAFLGGTK